LSQTSWRRSRPTGRPSRSLRRSWPHLTDFAPPRRIAEHQQELCGILEQLDGLGERADDLRRLIRGQQALMASLNDSPAPPGRGRMSQHLIIRLLAVTLLAFAGIALLRRDIQVATLSAIGAMLGLTWNPPQPRPRRAGSPLTPPPTDGQTGNSRQSAVHHSPPEGTPMPVTADGNRPVPGPAHPGRLQNLFNAGNIGGLR